MMSEAKRVPMLSYENIVEGEVRNFGHRVSFFSYDFNKDPRKTS